MLSTYIRRRETPVAVEIKLAEAAILKLDGIASA